MALEEYLDGLFAEPGPGPATAAYREWEAFVAREQSASDEL
jgi:hypothetical protein